MWVWVKEGGRSKPVPMNYDSALLRKRDPTGFVNCRLLWMLPYFELGISALVAGEKYGLVSVGEGVGGQNT